MNETFEVRDMRSKEKFFVNDEYLNGYARLCGANATLVYLCLCRHADRHQESFPSVQTMAEKTGVSRASIMRGIKTLITWNIITKERERTKGAKWLNNRYVLLDKSVWKSKPSITQRHGKKEESQVANKTKSQVAHSDTKDTHTEKDTHTDTITIASDGKDIQEIIYLFREVNPAYEKFFARNNQRDAVRRLLIQWPRPKLDQIVKFLPESNSRKYWPKITSPLELEDNMGKLQARFNEEKVSTKNKVLL